MIMGGKVRVGSRVRMTGIMPGDPNPLPVGLEGTVTQVNARTEQVFVDWDQEADGFTRTLILLIDDPYEVV